MKISKEALDTIQPSALNIYLHSRGWRQQEKIGEFAFSFLPPLRQEPQEERELLLLLDRSFGDYYARLAEALRELERYEQRPWQDILLDVRATNTEEARVLRVASPQESFELEGIVIRLEKEGASKQITIASVIDGILRKVKVELSDEDYKKAIDAHKDDLVVRCEGELLRDGAGYRLRNPIGFSLKRSPQGE